MCKHPEWIIKRHEDLSLNPVKEFRNIYRRLSIPFSEKIQSRIKKSTNNNNPSEAPEGVTHQMQRDSKSNILNWQKRLTEKEVTTIRNIVQDISIHFYDDDTWSCTNNPWNQR